jgi:hypothetical protein
METLIRIRGLLVGAVLMFAVITLVIMLIGIKSSPAKAQEGATIITEQGCLLAEPGVPELFSVNDHTVITSSGTAKLTCFFEGPPISETVVDQGFLCGTYLGLTTESRYVYTRSGEATLICLVNPAG